jgi:hypothetical protein
MESRTAARPALSSATSAPPGSTARRRSAMTATNVESLTPVARGFGHH